MLNVHSARYAIRAVDVFLSCVIFVSHAVKRHSLSCLMCHRVVQCECGDVHIKQLVKCDSTNS